MQARQKSWVFEVWDSKVDTLASMERDWECMLSLYGPLGPERMPFRLLRVERPPRGGNQVEILGQTSFRGYHMVPCKLVQRRRDEKWFFVIERSSYEAVDEAVCDARRELHAEWELHFGNLEDSPSRILRALQAFHDTEFLLYEENWDALWRDGPPLSHERSVSLRVRNVGSETMPGETCAHEVVPVSIRRYEWNGKTYEDVPAFLMFEHFTHRWVLCVCTRIMIDGSLLDIQARLDQLAQYHQPREKGWFTRFCEWWNGIDAR